MESHRPLNHPLANTEKRSTVASRQTTICHTDTGTECSTVASRQTTVRHTDTGTECPHCSKQTNNRSPPLTRALHRWLRLTGKLTAATKRNGRWVALLRDASVYYYLLLLIVKKQLRNVIGCLQRPNLSTSGLQRHSCFQRPNLLTSGLQRHI